ncbi:MAG: 30S ribosomal protein S7 [Euryarchaeota archaeon]|nr:30S ribosomal protein S7 [Euryarchaeota archaeon]
MAEESYIETNNILVFGKYGLGDIVIRDGGLAKYISLNPVMVPHSTAKHANRWFGKSKVNIVERLMNNMMRTEVFTGKKMKTYRAVKDAFAIIETKTKKNPIQVLVEALENAAPREEITRLQFGGISVPKAVDISPSRRLDISLRNICRGAIAASFKNTKSIEQCLADELIFAAKNDMNSFAVSKKEEAERVAQSAR